MKLTYPLAGCCSGEQWIVKRDVQKERGGVHSPERQVDVACEVKTKPRLHITVAVVASE